jgi:hypothetical protein
MVEQKKGRGCFFYGCLTVAVVVIIGIIGIYFGVRFFAKQAINRFTTTNGVAIAPVKLPRAQGNAVTQRIEEFKKDLRAGRAATPLELTSDELDYFIRNSEGWAHMRDHLHVVITNSHIEAEISFPLEAVHPSFKGRFLNGTAEFEPKIRNGALVVDLRSVKAKGQPVPEKILAGLRQNLTWQPQGNDPNADLLRNLESVEVQDDRIVVIPKPKPPEPAKTGPERR